MKQSKTSKFIATFFSMALVLALAFAFTAKANAADAKGYVHTTALDAGNSYIVVVQNGTDSYVALTAPASSADDTKVKEATSVNVEEVGNEMYIMSANDNQVWNSSSTNVSGTPGKILLKSESSGGTLYFSVTEGLKIFSPSRHTRPLAFEAEDGGLYAYSVNGTSPNYYIYLALSDDEFLAVNSKVQEDAKAEAARVLLFKAMDDEEYADYEQAKEDAAQEEANKKETEAARASALEKVNAENPYVDDALRAKYVGLIEAATDAKTIEGYLADFENEVKDNEKKAFDKAVQDAKDKINAADCDSALKENALKELENAKTEEDITKVVSDFEKAVQDAKDKASDKGKTDANLASEKDKATADVSKTIAPENLVNYDPEEQNVINNTVANYIVKIKAAATTEEIAKLVNACKADIAAIPTSADKAALAKVSVKLKSVKAGKKKVTVKWSPKKSKFDGYVISYKMKGKKKAKTVTVKKANAAKKAIKKLKKGKQYKVKVRGFKLYGANKDIKVFGKWSKTKTSKKVK